VKCKATKVTNLFLIKSCIILGANIVTTKYELSLKKSNFI